MMIEPQTARKVVAKLRAAARHLREASDHIEAALALDVSWDEQSECQELLLLLDHQTETVAYYAGMAAEQTCHEDPVASRAAGKIRAPTSS